MGGASARPDVQQSRAAARVQLQVGCACALAGLGGAFRGHLGGRIFSWVCKSRAFVTFSPLSLQLGLTRSGSFLEGKSKKHLACNPRHAPSLHGGAWPLAFRSIGVSRVASGLGGEPDVARNPTTPALMLLPRCPCVVPSSPRAWPPSGCLTGEGMDACSVPLFGDSFQSGDPLEDFASPQGHRRLGGTDVALTDSLQPEVLPSWD